MRGIASAAAGWVAVFATVALVLGGTDASTAGGQAGLIVAHGDGRTAYVVVQFESETISGDELLDRSGLLVTEISFGGLGTGVCAIDETGCDIGQCRKRMCQGPQRGDPYWQYFKASSTGIWQVSPLGISGDTVRNGDVRVFVWSADPPDFAVPSIAELAAKAGPLDTSGVALQRYASDGTIDTGEGEDEETSIPLAGIVGVVLAIAAVGAIVLRQKMAGRSE